MATNITKVGGEKQVNFSDPSNFDNGLVGNQANAEVTLLANGNFLVVYSNQREGGTSPGDAEAMVVEFTAAGAVVPGSIRSWDFVGDVSSPDVAPRLAAGGGYALAIGETPPMGMGDGGVIRLVTSAFENFVVEDPVGASVRSPVIGTFSNGSYIVAYDQATASNEDTRFAIVNAAANAHVAGPMSLADSATAREFNVKLAVSGDTAAAVYVFEEAGSDASDDIVLKIITSTGAIVDTETVANVSSLGNPDVAALSDGRFVVVWRDFTATDLVGRIYDPVAGTFSTDIFAVSNRAGGQSQPHVTGLPDGGFIVSWTDASGEFGDTSVNAINARRFGATGAPAGDEFRVNSGPENGQTDAALAANATGAVFIAWTNVNTQNTLDQSPSGVQGQLLQATGVGPVVDADTTANGVAENATSGAMVGISALAVDLGAAASYSLIDNAGGRFAINATTGLVTVANGTLLDFEASTNHSITVRATDNYGIIFTDQPFTIEIANVGSTTTTGSTGNDVIVGEEGGDILSGGAGNDTVTGGAGPDSFLFNTALDAASNLDTITDFFVPDDTILLDNAIFTKLKKDGELKQKYFEVGKKADDKDDYVIYNKKTGLLSYDADGSKKKIDAIDFAQLDDHLKLKADDFLVV